MSKYFYQNILIIITAIVFFVPVTETYAQPASVCEFINTLITIDAIPQARINTALTRFNCTLSSPDLKLGVQPRLRPVSTSTPMSGGTNNSSNNSLGLSDTELVAKFQLPITISDMNVGLQQMLDTYKTKFVDAGNKSPKSTASTIQACKNSSAGYISYFDSPFNWVDTAYAAETFYYGHQILKDSKDHQVLAGKLKTAYLDLADILLTKANATDFNSLTFNNPFNKNKTDSLIGWNNLNSSWDAWNNDTCSSAAKPNLWASGWSLYVLATAYDLTEDEKYIEGFHKGSVYWNSSAVSPVFGKNYKDYTNISKKLGKYPSRVQALYTVGGTDMTASQTDALKMPLRYHYYIDDPGRFAINDTAIMALAMARGGLAYPSGNFMIADPKGDYVKRSWYDIGWYSMYSVYNELANGNLGYNTLDDVGFQSKNYEAHGEFSIYYLAKLGALTDNSYYLDGATKAIRSASDSTVGKSSDSRPTQFGYCLLRTLNSEIFDQCEDILSESSVKSNLKGGNYYYLFPAISQLDL